MANQNKRQPQAPDPDLLVLIMDVSHILERIMARSALRYGLTLEQVRVMSHVASSKTPITVSSLAQQLQREAHTTSGLVSRCEEAGLVTKLRGFDPRRRNRVGVQLTHKGRQALRKITVSPDVPGLTAPELEAHEVIDKALAANYGMSVQVKRAGLHLRRAALEKLRTMAPLPYGISSTGEGQRS